MRTATKTRLAAGALLVAAIITSLLFLGGESETYKSYLAAFLDWVQHLGPMGPVFIALIYIPACVFLVPGSPISLGAGFALGPVWGTVAVSAGSVMGATAAFLIGRTLARGFVEQRVAQNPKFAAIDRAVAEHGFKIVLLLRLSPIFPFNLLNYAFGLTRVSLRDYVLASWIGMFPATVVYVYIGSAVQSLADLVAGRVEGGMGPTVLKFVGLAVAVVVTVFVTRIAKRALDKAVTASGPHDQDSQLDGRNGEPAGVSPGVMPEDESLN